MLIASEIAALRGDDTPQRNAQLAMSAAVAKWREHPDTAAVLSGLGRYGQGVPLADCGALAGLFDVARDAAGSGQAGTAAQGFVDGFVSAMASVLAANPLGHVASYYFTNGILTSMILGQAGNATLLLVCLDGAGLARTPPPRTVSFTPIEMHEHVLAGAGETALYTREPLGDAAPGQVRLSRSAQALAPGMVLSRDGRHRVAQIARVSGRLVTLRLQRAVPDVAAILEYDLASGRLVHRASTSPGDSRHAIMVTLLGRMGRADAAPLLGQMARGCRSENGNIKHGASEMTRWQALRECLGLDTAEGFAALGAIADNATDPLAAPASALRAQLISTHPQLAEIVPCPA